MVAYSSRGGVQVYLRVLLSLLFVYMAIGTSFGGEEFINVAVGRHEDGFVVDAVIVAPVSRRTAWDVLTDFDSMSSIVHNLTLSKVISRDGTTLVLKQEGAVKYGPFNLSFQSEREIRLEPTVRIVVKQLSGSLKSMVSETRLDPGSHQASGVRITYRAEISPDSLLARLFGGSFVRDGVQEQFMLLVAEMKRREAIHLPSETTQGGESIR